MAAGQRRIIACSVVSILFWTGLNERTLSLFVLCLDPHVSDTRLAFFFAVAPATAILTVLTSPWVDLRGKKRLLVPFYFAGSAVLALLVGLPGLREWCRADCLVNAAGVVLLGYFALRSLGFAGWFPLINDVVPEASRGRFFGRLRTSWQTMLVVCSFAVGMYLGQRPTLGQFQVVFAVALAANLAMTLGIMTVPEAPVRPVSGGVGFWARLILPLRERAFRNFVVFGMLYSVAAALSGPFAIRCLKSTLGAGDNFVVWMDTLASLGAALTLALWGRFVDRFGSRPLFVLLLPPLALSNLLWLLLRPGSASWPYLVAGQAVTQGMLLAGIGVGITDMMLDSARAGYQSSYINFGTVANMLAAGAGPFLGTWVARGFGSLTGEWGPLVLDANRWVFLVRAGLLLVPLLLVNRLSRRHGGHVGEALQRLSAGLLSAFPVLRR